MKITLTREVVAGAVLLLTCTLYEGGLAVPQVTIRFDGEAPLSPLAHEPGELEAYEAIQEEAYTYRRLLRINQFLADYPTSEFEHLVLRSRWEARIEQGDPDEIIRAAEEALDAEAVFRRGKLGFVSEDAQVRGLEEFRFQTANQEALYYQSIVEAYRDLGDFEKMVDYGETGLAAAAEAWDLYDGAEEGTPEYQAALAENHEIQAFILFNIVGGYQARNDVGKIIEYNERILQLTPDDLQTLMTTSLLMAQQPQPAGTDPAAYMGRAHDYAERAVRQLAVYFSGTDRVNLDDGRRAALTGRVQYALGLTDFRLEDWEGAAEAFQAAIGAVPDNPMYYALLGVTSRQLGKLDALLSAYARAVYLDTEDPGVRADLETIYEARNGSLEGLDTFVQREGSRIPKSGYSQSSPETDAYINALIDRIDVLPTVFPPNTFCYQYYEFLASQDLHWARDALEIGVGSGVNSLILLDQGVGRVVGTDINEAAVRTFEQNASKFGYANRVDARLVPLDRPEAFSVIGDDERFDLIISNPPWEASTEPKRIADYAYLDSGWVLLRSMLAGFSDHLKADGKVWLLYGDPSVTPSDVPPAVAIIMQEAPENDLDATVLYRNARCSIVEILPKE